MESRNVTKPLIFLLISLSATQLASSSQTPNQLANLLKAKLPKVISDQIASANKTLSLLDLKKVTQLISNTIQFLRLNPIVRNELDAGIANACANACPNYTVNKPKVGYKPGYNGCGAGYLIVNTSTLPLFTTCCNEHDTCYGTCNKPKQQCDTQFNGCLVRACNTMRNNGLLVNNSMLHSCQSVGNNFYKTVTGIGCTFYAAAQSEACQCVAAQSLI